MMQKNTLTRDHLLELLRQRKPEFEQTYGITAIGIFGSFARDTANQGSDVDIVVKMRRPDLFSLVHVKEELEESCHAKVDIVHYRDQMNAFLKNRIDREAIYV